MTPRLTAIAIATALAWLTNPSTAGSYPDASLLSLARVRFGVLSKCERSLVKAAANGTVADCESTDDSQNDLDGADQWAPERSVRATLIAWFCTDASARERTHHRGVRLKSARVIGKIDLSFATCTFPISLRRSAIADGLDLSNSQLRALALSGSHTGAIFAPSTRISGELDLDDGFTATDEVTLFSAEIGSDLVCGGAHLMNPNGTALSASGLQVSGSVFLNRGFTAEGEVDLAAARIETTLDCRGAHFKNPSGTALNGQGIYVKGDVVLRKGFKAEGVVDLIGARIGADLVCTGAELLNPDARALSADRLTVKGHVFLRDECKAVGMLSFVSATMDSLIILGKAAGEQATVDLRNARVGTFWDDEDSWPPQGNLLLDGFKFELDDDSPMNAEQRLRWLGLQPQSSFHPRSYDQLASALRKAGRIDESNDILEAKEKELARRSNGAWFVMGWLIGYGYAPLRVAWVGLMVVIVGAMAFGAGAREGLMVAAVEGEDIVRLNALIYSIDLFTPLIDLYQADCFRPDATAGSIVMGIRTGSLLRWYFWFHIAAGWTLSTLLAIWLTGLFRSG